MKHKFVQIGGILMVIGSIIIFLVSIVDGYNHPDFSETRLFINNWIFYCSCTLLIIVGLILTNLWERK